MMEYWSTGILGFQIWNTTLETLIATFSRSPLGRHASLSLGTGQVVQTVNSASECSEGERQFASCHPHGLSQSVDQAALDSAEPDVLLPGRIRNRSKGPR